MLVDVVLKSTERAELRSEGDVIGQQFDYFAYPEGYVL